MMDQPRTIPTREIIEAFDALGMRAEDTIRGIEVFISPTAKVYSTILVEPTDSRADWAWTTALEKLGGGPLNAAKPVVKSYRWGAVNAGPASELAEMVAITLLGTDRMEL